MSIPDWYSFVLLALAAWRSFQLLAFDDITDGLRRRVLRIGPQWEKEGDPVLDNYRVRAALFLICPYCAGFWISVSWWLAWQLTHFWTVVIATPFAISVVLIGVHRLLASEEQ